MLIFTRYWPTVWRHFGGNLVRLTLYNRAREEHLTFFQGQLKNTVWNFFFFFFFGCTGAWTQDFTPWVTPPALFVLGIFEIGSRELICLGWLWNAIVLISASSVARITGVSQWHRLGFYFILFFNVDLHFTNSGTSCHQVECVSG
jgi:hypothetical protein